MKDDLFSQESTVRDFIFDGDVASVFDDMLSRSIPFYDEMQRMAVELSVRAIGRHTGSVYDIGCSTGNTLIRLMAALPDTAGVDFYGVEPSAAMREKLEHKFATIGTRSVKLLADPIEHISELPDAGVILM